MKLPKKWIVVGVLVVVVMFGYFAKVFPDPYHEEGNVTLFTWVYREVDELLHGEKEAED